MVRKWTKMILPWFRGQKRNSKIWLKMKGLHINFNRKNMLTFKLRVPAKHQEELVMKDWFKAILKIIETIEKDWKLVIILMQIRDLNLDLIYLLRWFKIWNLNKEKDLAMMQIYLTKNKILNQPLKTLQFVELIILGPIV